MARKKDTKKINVSRFAKVVLRILSVILGLVLFLAIGFKVWIFTWKTYRNDEFEFQYPNYIQVEEIAKYFEEEIGYSNIRHKLLISDVIDHEKLRNHNLSRSGKLLITIEKLIATNESYDVFSLGKELSEQLDKLSIESRLSLINISDRPTGLVIQQYEGRKAIVLQYMIQDGGDYYLVDVDIDNKNKLTANFYNMVARQIVSTLSLN